MANPKNPDTNRDANDTNRGSAGNFDELPNGRGTRLQDTAGRQTYGASGMGGSMGGSTSGQRDFYSEALSRNRGRDSAREELRPYDRREDYTTYGQGSERFDELQARSESFRGQEDFRGDNFRSGNFRGQESFRGESYRAPETYRTESYRGQDWQQGNERQGGHAGRTMALAAAGLGAAGVGLGLMRRGRWAKEPLCANDVMSRGVKTVLPEHTLREVARLMREENVGIVPVTDARGRLLGVVTDRDLVVRAVSEDQLPSQVRVSDIMSSDDLEVATPDDALSSIIELMGRKQVRRIPVVERDNRLVGIIAMADIATRAEFDEELQSALERISSRRSFWARLG